jgi:hypothetical protein
MLFFSGFYRISISIGKSWSPALEQRSSGVFKLYEEELTDRILTATDSEISSVKVIQFM